MDEKKIGVFSSVGNGTQNTSGEVKTVTLNDCSEDSPDTLYNVLFKEFDEDKNE